MEVRLDESGSHEPALGIDLDGAPLVERRGHARDALPADADVDGPIASSDARVPDHQVHGRASPRRLT
jgi:hypothetical protein